MTPLLAFPPPVPVSARIVIAVIGFGLALTLARSLAGSPAGLQRLIACFAAALCLAAFSPDDRLGILAFVGGACCGGLVHVPRLRAVSRPRPGRSAWGLIAACILVGPLLGLVVLGISDQLNAIMAVDRAYYVSVFILVGFYAGILGAMVVGVIVALSPGRFSTGGEADSQAKATAIADQTSDQL